MCTQTVHNTLCPSIEALAEESLGDTRRDACERFHALGWPTRKGETFRYCDLRDAEATTWALAAESSIHESLLDELDIPGDRPRLVFVNGRFDAAHSDDVPEHVRLLGPMLEETDLDRVAVFENDPFPALATALTQDGILMEVAPGTCIDEPLHVVHVTTVDAPSATTIRIIARLGDEARASIIETWVGQGEGLVLPVTEVELGSSARLEHVRLIDEDDTTWHLGAIASTHDQGSHFDSTVLSLGGRLVRTSVEAALNGPGADATVRGVGMGTESRHIETSLRVNHNAPDCTSREVFKNLMADTSTSAFTGRIFVALDAQKTDAVQSNRNLLLSPTARAWSRPQLEIYADDVKCTHGATTGQIEPEALFYLQARGITPHTAYALLAWAFVNEVVQDIPLERFHSEAALRVLSMIRGADVLDEGVVTA